MVLLSHDELTMVKQEEVIHSSKMRGLCISPRKVGGLSPAPASVAYGVDCELFLVCSKIVETNFKNDEHSAPYRWVTNTEGVRDTEKNLWESTSTWCRVQKSSLDCIAWS